MKFSIGPHWYRGSIGTGEYFPVHVEARGGASRDRVGTSKRAAPAVAPAPLESRRRYTVASLWGLAIGFVPFLYVLWNGRLDPLRAAIPRGAPGASLSAVYDLQARALFHGSWDVPKGVLGFEAFVVHGRHYTYFGPFASFLRMPILALTDTFDGRLTAPSMLLAWIVTAVFPPCLRGARGTCCEDPRQFAVPKRMRRPRSSRP